jgi:NitT/TauT family transport system substrate-binding protein
MINQIIDNLLHYLVIDVTIQDIPGSPGHPSSPDPVEGLMNHRRLTLAAAVLASTALVLAGCGGGSTAGTGPTSGSAPASTSGTASASGDGTTESVVIGGLLVGANAAINVGIEDGTFADHGLDVTFNSGLDGPAQLPALTTGATQFSICNPTSLLIANDKGLDVRLVSGLNYTQEQEPDLNGVVVKKGSGIDSFADLPGRTVSVNALQTHGDLMIKAATKGSGGDPEAITFNEIDFPDMLAQLEIGNTEAVWLPEPFLGMAAQNPEFEVMGYPFYEVDPGSPVQMICASGDYVDSNPEAVNAMRGALTDLSEQVTEDDAAVRVELVDFLGMPEAGAQAMGIETFDTEIRMPQLSTLNDLMVEYGMISAPVDLEAIVVP